MSNNQYDSRRLHYNFPRKFGKPQYLDSLALMNEVEHLKSLWMSRFKWNLDFLDLPNNYIENTLLHYGNVAYYKDEQKGHILLPCTLGELGLYGYPTSVTFLSNVEDFQFTVPTHNDKGDRQVEIIFNDTQRTIPMQLVHYYASIISEVQKTLNVYSAGMKKPMMLLGNFNSAKSLDEIAKNILDNERYIIIDQNLGKSLMGEINVIQNTSHNAQDLKGIELYMKTQFEIFLSKIGIKAPTIHKQAQVNENEMNKNDIVADLILHDSLECRIESANKIAELAQASITCENVSDKIESDNAKIEPVEV